MDWLVSIWISKPKPARRQTVGLLEGVEQPDEGGDLFGVRHLGKGEHQALGEPARLHQTGEEYVRGADAPVAYGGLHAFHPDAHVRGRRAVLVRLRDQPRRAGGSLVLLGVGAGAVAVLEVDAQVFDGLALQLGADAVVNGRGELLRDAENGGERGRIGGMLVKGAERLVAPGADGLCGKGVAGDVDRVDGLAGAGVSRVAAGEFGVHRGEGGADLLADRTGEARCHLLLLTHVHTLHSAAVSASRNQQSV